MNSFSTLKDHRQESRLHLQRTLIAAIGAIVLLSILILRLGFLQIYQNKLYSALSFNNQFRIIPIVPPRGRIYDRQGVLLADNLPIFNLSFIKKNSSRVNLEEMIALLSKTIELSEHDKTYFFQQAKQKRSYEPVLIRTNLSEEEIAKFSLDKHLFPQIEITTQFIRNYPLGDMFAHVLGYMGAISEKDLEEIDDSNYRGSYFIGKNGLEKSYETVLHGKTGYQHVETNARGRMLRILDRKMPTPGYDLHLSIDSRLQKAAYQALKDKRGAVVALDPKTGQVFALLSSPSFDPNVFSKRVSPEYYKTLQDARERPLFNRAIRGQYPPASTIKPIMALQGLRVGILDPNKRLFDPGWYQLDKDSRLYHCIKRSGHGWMDLEKAITASCDTYFFDLAHRLGIKHIHEILTQFGLGKVTGIDLQGEASGLVPSHQWKMKARLQRWFRGETLNVGIGQGYLLATPLQLAQVAAIFANRGNYVTPTLQNTQPDKTNTIPPHLDKHWDLVVHGMTQVIQDPSGTAHYLSSGLSYTLAGKTGTAQVFSLKQHERYEAHKVKAHLRDHSWFIGFAPIEDPKIAIAVIVENSRGASHIARTVLDAYFKNPVQQQPFVEKPAQEVVEEPTDVDPVQVLEDTDPVHEMDNIE